MKCIVNGRIITEGGLIDGRALLFDRTIAGIVEAAPDGAQIIDAQGGYVAPGLIDVHCHGFLGWDASNGDVAELRRMSRDCAAHGVTAWLPTTMTLPWPRLEACFAAIRAAMRESLAPEWRGARVLGCHAEGPFINPARAGAQSREAIQTPDIEKLRPWADVVRLMTVAPELPGALDFIARARGLGVRASMGHTNATSVQARAGIEAGIDHATHLFNAMPPLAHREPGAVGAALWDDGVYCELIADTFHVAPLLFRLLARLKGDHLVLITDSIASARLPDGEYDQMGQQVVVDGIHCRFPDGTIAGSCLTMDLAVRNLMAHAGLPLWQAVNMASLSPARSIGVDDAKGSLAPGKDADVVIADGDFHVRATFVGGEEVYSA